ncbi:hypothetical protein [Clostridium sp. ZS2-4]|uniref:hypothetical protein n=1 Tax=Clostridium sp. ZS2-4 TaxID=2987703 RepID=UPI00227CCCA2|nr:hypothetical protein [Clostridium sp. ZS2-4]MCY6355225.1 hypothetical protein [Clostridium sp. ZS2-4]
MLKVLLVIIVVSMLHIYSMESREFAMQFEVVHTYQQTQKGKKIKKDIISNAKIREFYNGLLSGISGDFLIDDKNVSFNAIKVNLKGNLNDKQNHSYKGSAKYKNKRYNLDITIKWNGIGATIFGTLYDKSNKNQIEFEIN